MSNTPRTDAALEADAENGGTTQLVALCRALEVAIFNLWSENRVSAPDMEHDELKAWQAAGMLLDVTASPTPQAHPSSPAPTAPDTPG